MASHSQIGLRFSPASHFDISTDRHRASLSLPSRRPSRTSTMPELRPGLNPIPHRYPYARLSRH
eukprot:1348204-Amorphochlora_amoeboformis.AAC.1